MRGHLFAILLFLNGLLLGAVLGWLAADATRVSPGSDESLIRYQFLSDTDGQLRIFDQHTGRHTSFVQTDGLWFVMTHDPTQGSVSYRRTELLEDPAFLEAAQELRSEFPGRLGGELILRPARENP